MLHVLVRDGSVDCFDRKNGKMLLCALWDMKPQELYDETGRRVTHFNDAMLRGKYVAQPDPLNLTAGDHEVHGFILKPMDFEAGKKYPVIFDIHGGPKTVYGPVFYHEMQYWASRGYFVIFCNPTGSDGRGAFMDIRGKYGTVDFDDLMAFCDSRPVHGGGSGTRTAVCLIWTRRSRIIRRRRWIYFSIRRRSA